MLGEEAENPAIVEQSDLALIGTQFYHPRVPEFSAAIVSVECFWRTESRDEVLWSPWEVELDL